ncbi:MAG: hypothetical protein J0G32_06090, partial [Alphaproteobacteria bacterium]|nr:hypothetical protein [Alphaproteobacteria bacterium]
MDIITKTSEPRLMKMLMDMRHDPKGTAIHFHFSNLTMHYRTNYHLRLALNTINEHLKNHSGVTYLLENQDIIVVLISSKADIIDKVVFNLKYLFQDDPLTKDNGFGENSLCSVYFLNFEMTKFIKKCDDLMKDYQVRIKKQQVEGHKGNVNLLSDVLKSIENKLFTEDIGKYIRRQPVAAIVDGNAKPQTIYEEVYVSLIHLKKILDERITQCSPRVINQFLVEKLDEIVLRHIMLNHENFFAKPVSLNLNIPAIMDEKF